MRLIGLLLALLTVLVYLPAGFHEYIYFDDPDYVLDNSVVQNGLTWSGFQWAFIGWHAGNWHPLTWLSLELDCQLFGPNAGAQHLVNVLFHAANAVLLFLLWWRLTKSCWPGALVAALFAWHPLHVESVAWVSERKDVLSTFFGLASLLFYARYVAETTAKSLRTKIFYILSLFSFVLSLLAKPMLVTLPFFLLLLDYWPLQRWPGKPGRLIWEKGPFFLLAAVSCVIAFFAQRHAAVVSLQAYGPSLRLENAVMSVGAYLSKTFWPVNLCVFYPLPPAFSAVAVALSASLLLVITLLAWRWRAHRYFLMGWLWFVGMLVPVIGLVQVGQQAMADRYTYLPAVGLFVAAAYGLAEAQRRLAWQVRTLGLLAGLVLAGCVAVTEHQLNFWRNSETLFTHTLAVTQNNGRGHLLLGVAYDHQGRTDEAIEQYRQALRLDARLVEAHNNLGNLLSQQGQLAAALIEYQAAVALQPATSLVHENLGTQLSGLDRFAEAMVEYQTAALLAPADPRPPYLMGKALLRHGDDAAAITAFQNALQLAPGDVQSMVFLARVLSADKSAQLRNGSRAVALAEQANTLAGGTQPFILSTLAMAYAETGRFEDARQTVQAALKLAGDDEKLTVPLQSQWQAYQANQPWRETFTQLPPGH